MRITCRRTSTSSSSGAQQDFSEAGVSARIGLPVDVAALLVAVAGAGVPVRNDFRYRRLRRHMCNGTRTSPRTRASMCAAGAQQTKPENGASDTNVIAGLGGSWNSQRNTLFLDFTRSVGPVSAGTVVERHQLRMQIRPRRVAALLPDARGARVARRGASKRRHIPDARVRGGRGRVRVALAAQLRVTATYNYRWQEYADELSDRSANGFLIGLVYEPKRAWIRAQRACSSNRPLARTTADDELPASATTSPSFASASRLLFLVGLPIVALGGLLALGLPDIYRSSGLIEIEGAENVRHNPASHAAGFDRAPVGRAAVRRPVRAEPEHAWC